MSGGYNYFHLFTINVWMTYSLPTLGSAVELDKVVVMLAIEK